MRRVLALTVAALVLASVFAGGADARPKYKSQFEKKYPDVKKKAGGKLTCNVCHKGKKKKDRNAYGDALAKHTGKNNKDAGKIDEALVKTEKDKPSKDSKETFGDILKRGDLPAGTK